MTDEPTCTKCPAFLHSEDSIRSGLCHGCRSGPPETKVDTPRDPAREMVLVTRAELDHLRVVEDIYKRAYEAIGAADISNFLALCASSREDT